MEIGFRMGRQAAKGLFFDRPKVIAMMDDRARRFLGRFGGFVRKTSRRSIRKRKSGPPSPAGQPPRSRTGLLRDNIFYSADPNRRSVVIGPVRLNKTSGEIPELLEYGGTAERPAYEVRTDAGETRVLLRRPLFGDARRITQTVEYPARPYMQPAFQKGLDRQSQFWRQSAPAR